MTDARPVAVKHAYRALVVEDDPAVRDNRLALLQELRALFLRVADISLLQNV